MTARSFVIGFFAVIVVGLATTYALNPLGVASRHPFVRITGHSAYRIPSESMLPSLPLGADVFVDWRAASLRDLLPSDVVVFAPPVAPDEQWIARVIAFGGETVELRDGQLFVNDELVPEDHYLEAGRARSEYSRTLSRRTVPTSHVFILGDNRDNSFDSRRWGTLERAAILGVVH